MAKAKALRVALAPVNGAPLDLSARAESLRAQMAAAEQAGARLLLFPKDALTGLTPGDMARGPLRELLHEQILSLAKASGRCLCALSFTYHLNNKPLPAIALLRGGRLLLVALLRGSLPSGRPRWARRLGAAHTEQAFFIAEAPLVRLQGFRLGFLFSHDAQQSQGLILRGAELLLMPAGDPASALWHESSYLLARSLTQRCGVLYCNAGPDESSTDAVYAGERLACWKGHVLAQAKAFGEPKLLLADIDRGLPLLPPDRLPQQAPHDRLLPFAPVAGPARVQWCHEALEICAQGLARRMRHIGAKRLVLGLSGGLDSAMALLTSQRALAILGLPVENLLCWSLPCFGTSDRTRQNARRLMAATGLMERELDISEAVTAHLKQIGHSGQPDLTFENAQARERTQILMDLANLHGGLMVGPGDMSELALGFTTYGGDHMSMYGVNAGLYKGAIRLILTQISGESDNAALSAVLRDILDTPISPELLPGGQQSQQTERLLGSYLVNDFILYHLLEGEAPGAILERLWQAFGDAHSLKELAEQLSRFARRFFANQFKRSCLPDGPQALHHSLSPRGGYALPSDASPAAFLDAITQATKEMET